MRRAAQLAFLGRPQVLASLDPTLGQQQCISGAHIQSKVHDVLHSSGFSSLHRQQQPPCLLTQLCSTCKLSKLVCLPHSLLAPAPTTQLLATAVWLQPWQQWWQSRGLLGVVRHKNYQDHNKKKPPKIKIKTPSAAKRRILVGEDGVMWRMQAGRRHKRYKKSRQRLSALKGMVPLHKAHAAKLKKLGYKRNWWYELKA